MGMICFEFILGLQIVQLSSADPLKKSAFAILCQEAFQNVASVQLFFRADFLTVFVSIQAAESPLQPLQLRRECLKTWQFSHRFTASTKCDRVLPWCWNRLMERWFYCTLWCLTVVQGLSPSGQKERCSSCLNLWSLYWIDLYWIV